MKLLAPSLLSADFRYLADQIKLVEEGSADIIHCDVMDGIFVPNITFGPFIVEAVRNATELPIDVHLMIQQPDKYIEDFVKAGANYISVHQETVIHLHRVIYQIKELNTKAGVVLNPATPVSLIKEVLSDLDFILLMSVNPGFGGQSFIPNVLDKIKYLDNFRKENNLSYKIEIDGGIDRTTIKPVVESGCDIFVAGSAIFHAEDITLAASELKQILNNY